MLSALAQFRALATQTKGDDPAVRIFTAIQRYRAEPNRFSALLGRLIASSKYKFDLKPGQHFLTVFSQIEITKHRIAVAHGDHNHELPDNETEMITLSGFIRSGADYSLSKARQMLKTPSVQQDHASVKSAWVPVAKHRASSKSQ
tara:strand:- start:2118 stop:2552 length:435 start_codon:yes stop_codon:yes gene_type:complete